jgi:hypothetical protein
VLTQFDLFGTVLAQFHDGFSLGLLNEAEAAAF